MIKDYNNGIFLNQDIKVFHELIRITNDENYQSPSYKCKKVIKYCLILKKLSKNYCKFMPNIKGIIVTYNIIK